MCENYSSYSMIAYAMCSTFVILWAIKEFTSYLKTLGMREAFYSLIIAFILSSIAKFIFC